MPRPKLAPAERIASVVYALDSLPTLVARASALPQGTPEALRAWEAVEVHGATIHRQSRLLAGKSKGG
jgi:hypothetical protein